MLIAVDAMGGDHAPEAVVLGVRDALAEGDLRIALVGRCEALAPLLGADHARMEIVDASEVVGMDEPATTPIRKKRDSSIRVACNLVRAGDAQAVVSCGNTGAALAAAKLVMGTITGVDRPALAAVFPNQQGRTVVLDVGANVDAKPAQLREFAVMGHFYAQDVLGTPRPRIGLLSIGEEAVKGTEITKQVFTVLEETGLNFVGNVEGHDVFTGSVDVVVCDGFVGNVLLKSAEALASLLGRMLREELSRDLRSKAAYLFGRPALDNLRRRTDYQETGAVPLLGLRGGCFIGHGRSEARAVTSAIRQAAAFARAGLHAKMEDKMAELHARERTVLGVAEVRPEPRSEEVPA
ncbi:MAG: phosphate acyltransferase PlsX [bacterium]|nr:phosphate acyltransferase PlsX [bacterium]